MKTIVLTGPKNKKNNLLLIIFFLKNIYKILATLTWSNWNNLSFVSLNNFKVLSLEHVAAKVLSGENATSYTVSK